MKNKTILVFTILLNSLLYTSKIYSQSEVTLSKLDKENILDSFVQDFSEDPYAKAMTFGFKIDEDKWHMVIKKDANGKLISSLKSGFPDIPIMYWEMDGETLNSLNNGLNGETVTSRARANDPYPLKTRVTKGFPMYAINKEFNNFLEKFRFHFWAKGIPEKFKLSKDVARLSHDAYVVGLVYEEGIRTVWYQIDPKQHMNKDEEDQKNTFNSLFIITEGKFNAKIDGKDMLFEEGNAYHIPADLNHEFWNSFDNPAKFILIMYGEGA